MSHQREVSSGDRFTFGKNWSRFLRLVDEDRIAEAEESLRRMLGCSSLEGRTFLDAGSGSGLFSLAAHRLGASVTSFDFDPMSVRCAEELRRRYAGAEPPWRILEGSVLDAEFLHGLGRFDVVYSWGVLHHTGDMSRALENVVGPVREGGKLFIAIYNDQGAASRRWTSIKRTYNRSSKPVRTLIVGAVGIYLAGRAVARRVLGRRERHATPAAVTGRGMNVWHDLVDWVGGYPFEVATPEEIIRFYRDRGFEVRELVTCGTDIGCNQFVFQKTVTV